MPKKKKEPRRVDLLEDATERLGPDGENDVAETVKAVIEGIGKICTEHGLSKNDGLLVIGTTFLSSAACALRLAKIPINEAVAALAESYEHLDIVEELDNVLTNRPAQPRQLPAASARSSRSKARSRQR